jgi:integrase/recombinase XerD
VRAKEISNICWSMVTDADGAVTDTIHLVNWASKGKRGGREIPMAKDLRQALVELLAFKQAAPEDRVVFSERDIGISAKALAIWFLTLLSRSREIGPEILRLGGRAKGERERGAPFYSPIL